MQKRGGSQFPRDMSGGSRSSGCGTLIREVIEVSSSQL